MTEKIKQLFLQCCWWAGLFHLTRYLYRHKLQILCYHGFSTDDESEFRPKLFITPATFEHRLKQIKQYGFQVLDLDEAVRKLQSGQLPDRALVMTIDDGFYNVAAIAADLIDQYELPATLYLTTYYAQKGTPIFRLAVQYLFWKTHRTTIVIEESLWNNDCPLQINLENAAEKEHIIWEVIRFGETHCNEPERVALTTKLAALLGIDYQRIIDSRILSLMSLEEARALAAKHIDVQLHTHRHVFSATDEAAAKKEIRDNLAVLSSVCDKPPVHFCYPSGEWDKQQWPWLAELGIRSATTCLPGLNSKNTPVLGLTRFLDGENISNIVFKAELFGFLECLRSMRSVLKP